MKIIFRLLLLLLLLFVAGCATSITPRYSVLAKNVASLRDLYGNAQNKIKVGEFTSEIKEIPPCRAGTIPIPDGLTIASFVKDGFSDELRMSGVYSEKSNTEIRGKILNLAAECNIGTGHWITEIELTIGNGNPFIVKSIYDFEGAFVGNLVYQNAQQSLNYALQDFYSQIIKDDNFKAAFTVTK